MRDVYVGADHRGFNLKNKIVEYLRQNGWNITDLSTNYDPSDDYPDIAINLGEEVVKNNALGVLICGSGGGVCVATNKVKGVKAAVGFDPEQAKKIREDDNVNIVCLSADFISEEENLKIVDSFLRSEFITEDRFIRRAKKVDDYETA
jgi:ribose 5-phosphate isomerase B